MDNYRESEYKITEKIYETTTPTINTGRKSYLWWKMCKLEDNAETTFRYEYKNLSGSGHTR